ncbi:MAG: DNA-directed RNA polymerase subunit RPC12/RpoP [Candidatus Paceibacteria bacterium]|jgi:DNA-directed RNA polymerase subunit RPC12/RpoP
MSDQGASVCFTCGQPSGDILRLNYLSNGEVCPACRDRLLMEVPAPLPSEGKPARKGLESGGQGAEERPSFQLMAQKGPGQLLHGDGPVEPA